MPTLRAYTLIFISFSPLTNVDCSRVQSHGRLPSIKASILFTISGFIIVAETAIDNIVQIFSHPFKAIYNRGLVCSAITFVENGTEFRRIIRELRSRNGLFVIATGTNQGHYSKYNE